MRGFETCHNFRVEDQNVDGFTEHYPKSVIKEDSRPSLADFRKARSYGAFQKGKNRTRYFSVMTNNKSIYFYRPGGTVVKIPK